MSSLLRTAAASASLFRARACHGGHADRTALGQWRAVSSQAAKLEEVDPSMFRLLQQEEQRQKTYLNLIASENFMSTAVLEALGSVTQNKSSEGYPGARYHSCCANIDEIERLCEARALELFGLRPEEWGVNVQSMSGSNANLYVYSALLNCHDRIMGLDLAHGGHLSHGYRKGRKNISMMSKYFETLPYHLDPKTGIIDYDKLDTMAELYRPKIIVAGTSAYSRLIDYARMRRIADKIGAYLMSDTSHISGLVATGLIPSPFEHSDIVTSSTAKTLRGPRGGLIFYRRGASRTAGSSRSNQVGTRLIGDMIDASVFPGHQSSPHNNTTAALSVALHQARSPEFREYQQRVLLNAKALADGLKSFGYRLVSGDTENHLVLLDLQPQGIDGARVERVLELMGVASNKNVVFGDTSAKEPSGLRIGSPAMTSRGLGPDDFIEIAKFVHRAVTSTIELSILAKKHAEAAGEKEPASLNCFLKFAEEEKNLGKILGLKREILAWVGSFNG
ncbi:serine hydroxymethyltransferase-like protein [Lasiosphaeria hispida]|uniref:glycine hydroxymethyltransferase n=1 Tax=Lasiosphaeria hispida TaxID=260671 RepID=A0AAJ0MFE3_9PEZI|nr:serine hydroxymethyltransferase-like protein [Lasiosphaeria hispida]